MSFASVCRLPSLVTLDRPRLHHSIKQVQAYYTNGKRREERADISSRREVCVSSLEFRRKVQWLERTGEQGSSENPQVNQQRVHR